MSQCPSCDRSVKGWPCDCGFAPKHHRESLKPAHQQRHYSEGISKDQFGTALYDAVFCFGEINALNIHIQQAIDKGEGYKIQSLKRARDAKRQEFAGRLVKLTPAEQDAFSATYPAIVTL